MHNIKQLQKQINTHHANSSSMNLHRESHRPASSSVVTVAALALIVAALCVDATVSVVLEASVAASVRLRLSFNAAAAHVRAAPVNSDSSCMRKHFWQKRQRTTLRSGTCWPLPHSTLSSVAPQHSSTLGASRCAGHSLARMHNELTASRSSCVSQPSARQCRGRNGASARCLRPPPSMPSSATPGGDDAVGADASARCGGQERLRASFRELFCAHAQGASVAGCAACGFPHHSSPCSLALHLGSVTLRGAGLRTTRRTSGLLGRSLWRGRSRPA